MTCPDIADTLADREKRYGAFTGHARITQALKRVMHTSEKWDTLDDDQREALEMIAHKIGRILNGDPHYHDSWHDIVGYTKLVADRLVPLSPSSDERIERAVAQAVGALSRNWVACGVEP